MVYLFRQILVLPLKVLLLICRFVPVMDQYTLVKWTWKVGREIDDGCLLVSLAGNKNIDEARRWAREVLSVTRSAKVVNVICGWEREAGGLEAIEEWIERGEEMGCADNYYLLITKLGITHESEKYDEEELIEEILESNFLPMEYTKMALNRKAARHYRLGEFDKAEEISDHILSVSDDLWTMKLKSIICLRRNEDKPAERYFAKCKRQVPEMVYYLDAGLTYVEAGRESDSYEWFYRASKTDENTGGHPDVERIMNSAGFAEYCAARDRN